MRYASLDIGSNTIRLLLAERTAREEFQPLRVERRITRLGGNFSPRGGLDEDSVRRSLEALEDLARILRQEKAEAVFAVATGVIREAKNGQAFLERVRRQAGISARLVSGEEEAILTWKGVRWSLRERAPHRLVADMGGWSTEILWVEEDMPKKLRSLQMGVVALCERILNHDPPTAEELRVLEGHIREEFTASRAWFEKEGLPLGQLHPRLVGTAGTMTTLAAIDLGLEVYNPQEINHHQMTCRDLRKIYDFLCSLPAGERIKIPGLEKGREDLIVSGTAGVLGLLEVFQLQGITVIDSGLLEGVLLDGLARVSES
jgi:exopolyphosphatase / guanosine-5'-triphosphate,3'-diphosphate pyrophosphatase